MPRIPRSSRFLIPNLITGTNIAIGFCSMLAAAQDRFDTAVHLLVLAIFCDIFDGLLARLLHATSRFGQQLDSLSDAISFGAAPAFLVFQTTLRDLGVLGVVAAVCYLMAGVLRLARFNLLSDAHEKDRRTLGVPIPIGAGYLMAAVLMRDAMSAQATAILVVVMALLMVSTVRLPQLKGRGIVSLMLLVGIANYLAVVAWPSWKTVIWWNLWNAVILLTAAVLDRRRPDEEPETEIA
ncbi:MAG: CDP-diacylglycerol--serine O-phosphatidyltransferase [Thermoanaerobaculia bacterium]|nr:CDP-diacylglycerol--serine O-phosphatidyltransferase [Thermoanaerobaculia bacterium]MCZ7650531.1 CDP-diacylglycerol--serine O-phosphatidyltransferase [Thermoanaerobaculia bacterium]